ncbi:hypothetical protein O181_002216 [Austropuccinia psidii MF-1]|uniref:Uncharacterized protein n=1 Tax=Austropuccinia psidii MF-1 TaxID=1389203 RepID=A0A9Q3BCK7_9BASI|nr:hypothetical protein [Austropuccinia psidii MF-1]
MGQIRLRGQPRLCNPKTTFISQSVIAWVRWLLNIPGVEACLDEWECKVLSQQGEVIFDVAQGSVWKKSLSPNSSNQSLQLQFALFVDWFNPRGNKIAGKQLSMGILVLYCLNLPPQERFQPKYTCLAGLIPLQNQPNMITTNHILKPLVYQLIQINVVKIPMPNYPRGREVVIQLVCLIGNIVATHKAAGFLSHSAKKFCS